MTWPLLYLVVMVAGVLIGYRNSSKRMALAGLACGSIVWLFLFGNTLR